MTKRGPTDSAGPEASTAVDTSLESEDGSEGFVDGLEGRIQKVARVFGTGAALLPRPPRPESLQESPKTESAPRPPISLSSSSPPRSVSLASPPLNVTPRQAVSVVMPRVWPFWTVGAPGQ